jgi:hypothetical protein
MMGKLFHVATAFAVGIAGAGTGSAQTYNCDGAQRSLTVKRQDVAQAVRKYSACVGTDKFDNNCSDEFTRLRHAHADYERALLDTRRYCGLR